MDRIALDRIALDRMKCERIRARLGVMNLIEKTREKERKGGREDWDGLCGEKKQWRYSQDDMFEIRIKENRGVRSR